jgi:hypothetical protein
MKMKRALIYIAAAYCVAMAGVTLARAQGIQLYGPNGQYLGNLNDNPFDPNSVNNQFGRYGSQFSPDSIRNPYSRWGSEFSPDSPHNPFAIGRQRPYFGGGRSIGDDDD